MATEVPDAGCAGDYAELLTDDGVYPFGPGEFYVRKPGNQLFAVVGALCPVLRPVSLDDRGTPVGMVTDDNPRYRKGEVVFSNDKHLPMVGRVQGLRWLTRNGTGTGWLVWGSPSDGFAMALVQVQPELKVENDVLGGLFGFTSADQWLEGLGLDGARRAVQFSRDVLGGNADTAMIFADWLDENGMPGPAEDLRCQSQAAGGG